MKHLLTLIFCAICAIGYGQFAPTGTKTNFKNGIALGSKDSTAFSANDSLAVTIDRNGRFMYRGLGANAYWKVPQVGTDTVPDTRFVRLQQPAQFRQDGGFWVSDTGRSSSLFRAPKFYGDTLQATGSGGGVISTNGGTTVASWGAGGSAEFTAHGFAGYNTNRSSSYTGRSWTDKGYVDSADALRVKYSDTASMLTNYVQKFGTLANRRVPFVNALGQLKDTAGFVWEAETLSIPGSIFSTGGIDASYGFFTTNQTGNVGSFQNTNSGGTGLYVQGGATNQKYSLFINGYSSSDSIANFNPIKIGFYKPLTTTTIASTGTISSTGAIISERVAGASNFIGQISTSALNDSSQVVLSRSGSGTYNLASIDTRQETANASTGSLSINTYDAGGKQRGIMLDKSQTATIYRDLTVTGPVTATIATAAQPNITSLGTQTALTVSGIAYMGGRTTNFSSVFKLQHGDGSADTRALFNSNNAFSLAVRQGTNNIFYFGADASGNGIFSNNGGTNVANINATTGAYTATSDSIAKKNIADAIPALDSLMKIKIRSYDWKLGGYEPWGVIAQELYKVTPTYVSKPTDTTGRWGVSKAEMVPMLIKAIQELKTENDKLKSELADLKAILKQKGIL